MKVRRQNGFWYIEVQRFGEPHTYFGPDLRTLLWLIKTPQLRSVK